MIKLVKVKSGEDIEEILMVNPVLGKEVNRQGRIWKILATSFLRM